jgi:hypothetical protein
VNPKFRFGVGNHVCGSRGAVPPIGVVFFQHASRVPKLRREPAKCLLRSEMKPAIE